MQCALYEMQGMAAHQEILILMVYRWHLFIGSAMLQTRFNIHHDVSRSRTAPLPKVNSTTNLQVVLLIRKAGYIS